MNKGIKAYNDSQEPGGKKICELLAEEIQWGYKNIIKHKAKLERLK